MMTGPQPVPVYSIHVVPPIGSGSEAMQTPSATPSDPPAEVTTTILARSIPTKSGMLLVAAMGALALVAILIFSRRD